MEIIAIVVIVTIVAYLIIMLPRYINNKRIRSVTQLSRGTQAERIMVLTLLHLGVAPEVIFHDLYVKKFSGEYSQVDLVVITNVGVIVIEVKDYSGWIFGNGRDTRWTQVLAYGKQKYHFYNPVMQNNKHIVELKKKIKQNIPFYSVIVFYGDCELKNISLIPNGTYIAKSSRVADVLQSILTENKAVKYTNMHEVISALGEAVQNGSNREIRRQHIMTVRKQRFG